MEPMHCLIGKFFTRSTPPSLDVTETSLRQRWNLCGDMTVSSLEKGLVLFNFELETDMRLTLQDSWHVNGVTLVLKQWPSLTNIDFSVALFWVKAEGLPLSRYTDEEARRIGERLSDKPLANTYISPSKRVFLVRAEIDLKKPLNPGFFFDKQRKSSFVQFKYRNLGLFCLNCGKIDHSVCGKTPEERPLTGEIKTRVYGPWLRCPLQNPNQELLVEFPEKISEQTEDEETVPYKQFFIKLRVDIVYANDHKWGGKTLSRCVSEEVHEHRFRFPCSRLATALESSDRSEACETLAREIDENVPLTGLTFGEKLGVVERFVDYSEKNMKTWSDRRWVPVRIHVKKTTRLSCIDFQTKLQEREDEEFRGEINQKISDTIRRRVENNEDILSVPVLTTCIKDSLEQFGITETPSDLAKRAIKARKEAIEHGLRFFTGPVPAEKASVRELERVKILGQDMDSLDPCVICQEGMFLGDEATRMPCSHLLHRVCIEAWLQKGNQCPLCRFKLPSQPRAACPVAIRRYLRMKQHSL